MSKDQLDQVAIAEDALKKKQENVTQQAQALRSGLPDRYLNNTQTKIFIGNISSVTLRRYVRDPNLGFPKPFYLNQRMPLFKLSELEAWVQRRLREAHGPDNLKEGRKKGVLVRIAKKAERDANQKAQEDD